MAANLNSMRKIFLFISLLLSLSAVATAQYAFEDERNRASQIDYSEIALLRWAGPGAPGTYEEYMDSRPEGPWIVEELNSFTPALWNGSQGRSGSAIPRVLVMVNSGLLPGIQAKLDTYLLDLRRQGYDPSAYACTAGNAEDLKSFIQSQSTDLVGCVFVGDVPAAWYEIDNDFQTYGYASFPCDLFLMDLDGLWIDDDSNGRYDKHEDGNGDVEPEIFVGRIDASRITYDTELNLMNDYFDKLHEYYTGNIVHNDYALTYTEDDWSNSGGFWLDIAEAFPDNEAIRAPDTNRDDYRDVRLPSTTYDFIQLACHSWSGGHAFTRGGSLTSGTIWNIPPQALFYNLFCCSASRFTNSNCLGAAYVFNSSLSALATIGSTKTGSMLGFYMFYGPMGKNRSFGQSFKQWFVGIAPYSADDISWHYGMCILGDPMGTPCRNPEPQALTFYVPDDFATIQAAILDQDMVRDGDTIAVRPGTYFEQIDFTGRALTVKSLEGPGQTVLDGGGSQSVVSFVNGEGIDSCLDGFTVTNGQAVNGGGILCVSSSPSILNSIIVANTALSMGGGIHCDGGSPAVMHSTIYGNQSLSAGGGLCSDQSACTVVNSIIRENSATTGPQIHLAAGSIDCTYSNIQGGWPGAGNIKTPALFVDPDGPDDDLSTCNDNDFHLTWTSPCVNRGMDAADAPLDMDGDARPYMGTSDMGTDEFTGTHPLETETFALNENEGGTIGFTLNGGTDNKNRDYILLGTLSGTAPGMNLPGGTNFPLNWDLFTGMVYSLLNSVVFDDFLGTLDSSGTATALCDTLGPVPDAAGLTVSFAFTLLNPFNFVSNPIDVHWYISINYMYDDGSCESPFGFLAGGELCWMHWFEALSAGEQVSAVHAAWGSAASPGVAPPNGTPSIVYIWDDPNNDGDPADAVFLAMQETTVQNVDTDTLNEIVFDPPVEVSGKFFVGCSVDLDPLEMAAPLDLSSPTSSNEAWIIWSPGEPFDYLDLSENYLLSEPGDLGYPNACFLLRATTVSY